ncbi:MAG: acyl carrier protein [Bacillales bacterium]|nr:acyl carrier protein [Bacillales bacterium]
MTNKEKYINAFVEGLEMDAEKVIGVEYQGVPEWDSVGHMSLVACIEDAFEIMMDTDDIVDFSSYDKGIEILRKYDVVIDE